MKDWTYRATTNPTAMLESEAEARERILSAAYRVLPPEEASAEVVTLRRTPTGRWSALVRRIRQP